MKTLKEHVIIYDDECPMCDLYTRAFVKMKMLEENGREPYSWITTPHKQILDKERARNEIALINTTNGSVTYGVESLFTILGYRFPWLRPIMFFPLVNSVMQKIYAFISYNRRVIIPANKFESKNSCTPDFHRGYRWAYIIFAWFVTSLILTVYAPLLPIPQGGPYREFIVCGGQIVFQAFVILLIKKEKTLHYIGNMMTISLAGSILLLPSILLTKVIAYEYFSLGWFFIVVGLMFLEHHRRTRILDIHWTMSATWVLYRAIIVVIYWIYYA
jgi:hypothetical protein